MLYGLKFQCFYRMRSVLNSGKVLEGFLLNQERQYAARKGTRAKQLAKKMERKMAEATKAKKPVQQVRKARSTGGELDRRRDVSENWMTAIPFDNVWRTALYRGKPYPLEEIVSMHKEVLHPTMVNDPDAFVYATVEVDLRLKKKEQYLSEFSGVITYPNEFKTSKSNKVIVVCKTPEDQAKASDAGAIYVGSTSLIKQILSGEVSTDEFDYLVCHPDTYKEIGSLRGILKKNFPSTYNGLLRIDIDKAVKSFMKGIKYELKRSTVELDYGWSDVCFGRLEMSVPSLEDNMKHMLNTLEKHRPMGVKNLFVTKALVWCEKSTERFKLPHWEYLHGYEKC